MERGYEGTTIDAIAAEAGVAPRVWHTNSEDKISIADFVEAEPLPVSEALVRLPALLRRLHALPPFGRAPFNTTCTFLLAKGPALDGFLQKFQAANMLPKAESEEFYRMRWPILSRIPAVVRFVSYEPAIAPLGAVDIGKADCLPDWIICGGESGNGARHMKPAWARFVRDECADLGIAFFMKDIAEIIRSAGIEPSSFALSGGLASISYLVQVQSDLLRKNAVVSSEQEVSALGAALLAGLQHGTWNSTDIKKLTSQGETVKGEANPGAERRYKRWKELHQMTRKLDQI